MFQVNSVVKTYFFKNSCESLQMTNKNLEKEKKASFLLHLCSLNRIFATDYDKTKQRLIWTQELQSSNNTATARHCG